ncbi:coproporphyrinogen-III oxidase family protein [Paraliomyxa miuraensis]|uniref:coproporphyrinogen-III oxidase family protein n=1 Tax=Paraliomyxa miuraensis TaxID=376150 RepID=UPI0022505B7E|nr:radical SAM protein [Paraliomyxa miuraensis]MCX4242437.1 radical SAM protein [Paraliomyxa miuraensis]
MLDTIDARSDLEGYEPDMGALLARHPELQIERDDYNINVTANYGERLTPQEVLEHYRGHPGAGAPTHLYYHFPLCAYICHFCNYVKQLAPTKDPKEAYARWTRALVKESTFYLDEIPWVSKARIESFYIGGGTAALLEPEHLAEVLEHVRSRFSLIEGCELNIEGNPDNFCDPTRVTELVRLGFNRFSVGVQSFTEDVTRFTNRGHTAAMSRQAIENLVATGLPFNVDMMFGLPHQDPDTVAEDLRTLVELQVPTITIYRLRNADRAAMGIGNRAAWNLPKVRDRLQQEGLFPSLHTTYAMRQRAVEQLLAHGYRPSPCGWWSRPDTYPEGNIPRVSRNKWQRFDTMLAFGPGAYGWLTGHDRRVVQTHNVSDIREHIERVEAGGEPPLAFGRLLTGVQAVATALGFAYKSCQPIEVARFREGYGVELLEDEPYRGVFEELESRGLVSIASDRSQIRPTLNGETLHEEIISIYLHERIGSFAAEVCHKV